MKKTVKKELVKKANELKNVIDDRRELEKVEKKLKTFFKDLIGDDGAIQCGDILIMVENCQRSSLDQKALSEVVDLDNYRTTTDYKKLNIKAS